MTGRRNRSKWPAAKNVYGSKINLRLNICQLTGFNILRHARNWNCQILNILVTAVTHSRQLITIHSLDFCGGESVCVRALYREPPARAGLGRSPTPMPVHARALVA